MSNELSPQRKALLSRIASLSGRIAAGKRITSPGYNGKKATAAAKAGFWSKLDAEVDPQGILQPEERRRRAKRLWQARMNEGKLKRAQAELRALKKGGRKTNR